MCVANSWSSGHCKNKHTIRCARWLALHIKSYKSNLLNSNNNRSINSISIFMLHTESDLVWDSKVKVKGHSEKDNKNISRKRRTRCVISIWSKLSNKKQTSQSNSWRSTKPIKKNKKTKNLHQRKYCLNQCLLVNIQPNMPVYKKEKTFKMRWKQKLDFKSQAHFKQTYITTKTCLKIFSSKFYNEELIVKHDLWLWGRNVFLPWWWSQRLQEGVW